MVKEKIQKIEKIKNIYKQRLTETEKETFSCKPWGVLLTEANKNNLLYTAREFDFDNRLYYFNFYYYNPYIAFINIYYQFRQEDIKKIYKDKYFVKLKCVSLTIEWWVGNCRSFCEGIKCDYYCWDCIWVFCSRPVHHTGIEIYENECTDWECFIET